MISGLTIFGAEGIAALGVDVRTFVIQFVTFVICVYAINRFAMKPILNILRERRETIEKGVSLGEKMQKDEARAEQRVAEKLQEARAKADQIVASASDEGRQIIAEAENKAKQKAESIVASARDKIEHEKSKARKQLETEVADLLIDATEAVIDEKLDSKKDAQLIERALKEAN